MHAIRCITESKEVAMDNNNIGGMNPQQFSQNMPQTSQPHMGMSGIELQNMQQEAEQRRREQSRRNADFFGRLCIPTIIYALLYTIFLYENTGGILVTLFAIVTGVYSLYCMKILHIEAKPLTVWYSVMMILTGLSSGLTGNKIIQGFNFCWILVFLVFMLLHNFCNDRQWGLIKYIAAAFQAVFGAIGCIAEPFMDIADYMRNERMDSDSMDGDSANATATGGHVKKHRMLYVFIGIAIAFPLVVLIVVLLCSADAVFASVIKKIFADINFFTVSKVVFLFVFALFSSYCGIKYLSKKRISDAPVETPAFPAAIGITVAATISVVYVFFCFIQIVYLFGGLMQLPSGYTYARYAREGFFQLLFVCILNVIIVLLGSGLFRKNKILNAFLILITLCTYIMIASSAYRMGLYVSEYGLTATRLCVFWALGVIALFMLGVILSICKSAFSLFRYGIIVIGVCYLVLAFARPDYLVARYNTVCMEDTDYKYLMSLSTDASPALAADADFMENKGMVTMYARQLAGETNDSLRQFNVSHIKAAHLFRDSINEVKNSQLILLYVYSPYDSGSYNNNDTGLDGVDSIQMGYHVLKDTEDDDTAYYDYDSYSMDDTRVAAPVFFKWVDAVEVKKISDSERIFLAKIPRKALKGKDGVNIEYRFNKNGDVIYSSQYNVILDKKKGLNEVELSYYAGTDGVDVPEYNIYGK